MSLDARNSSAPLGRMATLLLLSIALLSPSLPIGDGKDTVSAGTSLSAKLESDVVGEEERVVGEDQTKGGQATAVGDETCSPPLEQSSKSSLGDAGAARRPDDDECTLYLGPSSIPNAGLGMYTAVDVKKGQSVGDREVIVPIPDRKGGGRFLVDDITWAAELHGDFYHEGEESVDSVFPGFGAAANSHLALLNVENHGEAAIENFGLHRSKDPGVGAFSYYTMSHKATEDIKAGSELFVNYGEDWFVTREETMGKVPLKANFQAADRIVRNMVAMLTRDGNMTDQIGEDIWHVVRTHADERVRAALPLVVGDIHRASTEGSARHSLPDSIRSQSWLRENAMCVDHLYVDKSTVHQAGAGAFAKRFIAKDSVVSPIPVLQIKRNSLAVKGNGRSNMELLLNYCYGNRNSSIVLVPYSPLVNFVNHHRTAPNAKLRWSKSHLNKQEWLLLSSTEVLQRGFGLTMELVATRDIFLNEEVFVDYGSEWESAWAKHVQDWTPPKDAEGYISAAELAKTNPIRTEDEQRSDPYAANVVTGCNYWPRGTSVGKANGAGIEEIRKRWSESNNDCLRPCRVIARETVDGVEYFTAEMSPPHMHEDCVFPEKQRYIVSHIPRRAMRFIDQTYTKDQYLQNAFRHEIGLPSDVFPTSWMDIN